MGGSSKTSETLFVQPVEATVLIANPSPSRPEQRPARKASKNGVSRAPDHLGYPRKGAHNPKVQGSNPSPATNRFPIHNPRQIAYFDERVRQHIRPSKLD